MRAGGLEEGQGMGQTSGNTAIHGRLANVSLAGQEFFFFFEGGFGSFFWVVFLVVIFFFFVFVLGRR